MSVHQFGGPGGASVVKGSRRKATTPQKGFQERTQECVTGVLTKSVHQCGGPGGASVAKGSRRKATNPGGMQFRADSGSQGLGPNCSQYVLARSAEAVQCLNIGVMAAVTVV